MISLTAYKKYWEDLARCVYGISDAMPVTVDEEMGKRLNNLKKDSVILFYLPPTSSGEGNIDNFSENNLCVIFIMKKYDPQRETTFDVLAETQPIIETIKRTMLDDMNAGCSPLRIDITTLQTIPETEFYRSFAGWSVGFTVKST